MRKALPLVAMLLLMLFLLPHFSYGQEKTISGKVLAEDKSPLTGVSIRVKGTRRITQTNAAGDFTISAAPGETLQISYVGFESQDLKVGADGSISITLKATSGDLGEVVVTAMDIKRDPRELGFSTQRVSGDDIKESQRENFLNSLQGRVAGLTVNPTSGMAGASSAIVLRGYNSLSLSNSPLFVVDGVIMDNDAIDEMAGIGGVGIVERTGLANTSNRNSDHTNRMADMNPNDIASITVLKGPEATALYGSQASSGAIVITTRKAKSNKLGLQYDNSFRIQEVVRFPKMIDKYQSGTNGLSQELFSYFGPEIEEGTKLYNNKDNFFKTGFSQNHNLGLDFGIKSSVFRFSTSYFDQDGIVPNNKYKRINFRLANTTKIGKWLEIMPAISYIRSENKKVMRGTGGFMISLLSWPNQYDIRNYQTFDGRKATLYNDNPNSDIDNPLFSVNKNKGWEENDRITASLGININPTDWLSIAGRFGYDTYKMYGYTQYHPDSYFLTAAMGGVQDNYWRKLNNYNHTITATAKKKFGDFSTRLMIGTMWQDNKTSMFSISGNTLVDLNRTDSGNTVPASRQRLLRNDKGLYNLSIMRQLAYFGEAFVGYKNLAFLSATYRMEEASTLTKDFRNYSYPGASLSLIMSDIFPGVKKGDYVSFWKLRGSLAGTARLNPPYSTQSVFINVTSGGGGYQYGFTNANPLLEPEKQRTFEVGSELRLFNNRLSADVAYYNTLTSGQIINGFRLSYGTGYVLNSQNAGSTRNEGVEVVLGGDLVQRKNFSWNMQFNFNKMWGKVVEMPANVAEYYLADTWVHDHARGGIMLGSNTTTITTFAYERNTKGDILVDPLTGLPVVTSVFKKSGDRNPDYRIGWVNNLTYKNWRLNFVWDLKVGGDIFNGNEKYLTQIGRSRMTLDRYEPLIVNGVLKDGNENSATPTKNNIVIIPAYNDTYYKGNMPGEVFVEKDVNWFRLRDLTLSYTFNENFTRKIKGLKNLGVFFTGNDLILLTNYSGADPAVNANTSSTKGVGAVGFDYGTLPTPISFNIGLRANF